MLLSTEARLIQTIVVLVAVIIVGVAVPLIRTPPVEAQPGQILEGSWIEDVTNEQTGARQITLYTFIPDGGLISSNRDFATRGPAHGAWIRTGDRQFAITFVRVRNDTNGNFINGMGMSYVQQWLAHLSPEMTLVYARVSEDTMRKQWEQAMARGAVHVASAGP